METPENDRSRNKTDKHPTQLRLIKEKRWKEAQSDLKRLRKEATYKGMDKEASESWAWAELDRLFPPIADSTREPQETKEIPKESSPQAETAISPSTAQEITHIDKPTNEPAVTGLNKIPKSWGKLPPNAALAVEISWVQANRLSVVEERGDKINVFLGRALNPAPSHAALGWLETSIKTYSKFVEVAAKATASVDADADVVRREKLSIEEVRRMLTEMLENP